MTKAEQLAQVRKRTDLLSLALVSKAVYEILKESLWRSITIKMSGDRLNSVPPFPSFPPDNRPLDLTKELHFSSELVKHFEERCPHFPEHDEDDSDSDEDDVDGGEDESGHGGGNSEHGEDDALGSYERFDILETGLASILDQLQDETLRSLR